MTFLLTPTASMVTTLRSQLEGGVRSSAPSRQSVRSRSKWQTGSTPQPCTETVGGGESSLRYGILTGNKRKVSDTDGRHTSGMGY